MDLSGYSVFELFNLYNKIGWELFKRTWYVLIIIAVSLYCFKYIIER